MLEIRLLGESATRRFASALAPHLRPGDLILLQGPLGAGKTCLVRALVGALAGDESLVASPTFSLMHRYDCRPPILHVDAYRLASLEELQAVGFDEQSDEAIACVEWPERVAGLTAARVWQLGLEHLSPEARRLTLLSPTGCRLPGFELSPAADHGEPI